MKKIGLFLDEIKDKNIDENQKFSKLGFNTGNMLFWHSLKVQLDLDVKSRWYIDHIDQLDLTQYKAFVTTDLIWIRQMQDFSYLNKTLDGIGDLPLIPISIGLQCDSCLDDFKLHPETVKVLKRISERCVMGVRGNYTASILRKYGIDNFKVIGCPSMYMNAPGLLTVGNNSQPHKVSMNFETFYSKLDEKRINFLEYGAKNQFDFVEQAQAELTKEHIQDKNRLLHIQDWMKNKQKSFFNIDEWRSYMREHDFSFGSRFHGNVLALWEGVPALFITCDSRTQELCEHFYLPCIDVKDFDKSKPVEYYYGLADYTKFHQNYSKRVEEWKEFLEINKLKIKDKVLYHAYHAGILNISLIHRLTENKSKEAVLLVGMPQLMGEVYDKLNEFVAQGIFDKILYCSECVGLKAKSTFECESMIVEHFDKVFNEAGMKLDDFSQIYSGVDTLHSFGVYMSLNKKGYFFLEMHPDFFMVAQKRVDNLTSDMKIYASVMTQHGASNGTGNHVTRIVYKGSKYDITENYKVVEFDYNLKLLEINNEYKEKLLKIFGYEEKLKFDKPVNLLVTSSQWLLRDLPDVKRKACTMYQIIADYYIDSNTDIIIKPHPLSRVSSEEFQRFFDVPTLPRYFPTNFIPLISDLKINSIYASTSAISDQIEFSQESVLLGDVYVKNFLMTYKIHFCISLFNYLKSKMCDMRLYHYGISNDYINNLIKYSLHLNTSSTWLNCSKIDDGSFCIIDDIYWNKGSYKEYLSDSIAYGYGSSVYIFINSKKDFFFLDILDETQINNLFIIDLEKNRTKKEVNSSLNTESLFIYCADKKLANMINNYKYLKSNKYLGFDIKSKAISGIDMQNRVIMHYLRDERNKFIT